MTLFSCSKASSQCFPDSVLFANYKNDVNKIALNYINDILPPEFAPIKITTDFTTPIWESLASVYYSTSIPERDTIFNVFCIHTFTPYIVNGKMILWVKPEDGVVWESNWANSIIFTGSSQVDSFLSEYGFKYVKPNWFPGTYELTSDSFFNLPAFAYAFSELAEIEYADVVLIHGDGNKIKFRSEGINNYIDFKLAWGDCQAGCIDGRTWMFKTSMGCTAEYLGKYDDPGGGYSFPHPVNCNLFSYTTEKFDKKPKVHIWPNPALNELNIQLQGVEVELIYVECFDLLGRLAFSTILKGEVKQNLSGLMPGAYVLKITDTNGKSEGATFIKI